MRADRRQLLAGCTAAAVGSLAGCGSVGSGGSGDAPSSVPWPEIRAEQTTEWRQTGRDTRDHGERWGVSIYSKTRRWEDATLRRSVEQETLGAFDRPIAQLFATTVELRGLLNGQAGPSRVMQEVLPSFRRRLNDGGVNSVEQMDSQFPVPEPNDGTVVRELRGVVPTPPVERTVELPNVGSQTITLAAGTLPIRGVVAVWKPEARRAFVAGGAHPAADYERSERVSVTGEPDDGIDIVVEVDLNLKPTWLARRIRRLAESVTAGEPTLTDES